MAITTHDLADALPLEKTSSGGKRKVPSVMVQTAHHTWHYGMEFGHRALHLLPPRAIRLS